MAQADTMYEEVKTRVSLRGFTRIIDQPYWRLRDYRRSSVRRAAVAAQYTQNWRGSRLRLCSSFDFVELSLPFEFNPIHLILHERFRKALFELKQTPAVSQPLVAPMNVDQ
jgi:hypothetical protein